VSLVWSRFIVPVPVELSSHYTTADIALEIDSASMTVKYTYMNQQVILERIEFTAIIVTGSYYFCAYY